MERESGSDIEKRQLQRFTGMIISDLITGTRENIPYASFDMRLQEEESMRRVRVTFHVKFDNRTAKKIRRGQTIEIMGVQHEKITEDSRGVKHKRLAVTGKGLKFPTPEL